MQPDLPSNDQPSGPKPRRRRRLGLRRDMSMPDAGRRIMAFHFARLRKLEKPAASADEEAIHDMRVAIRRLRAALRLAGPYFKRKTIRSFRSDLRQLADTLGAARDLDVIIAHGAAFAQGQPPDAPAIDTWLNHLHAKRAEAQQALRDYLAGRRFAKFVEPFEAFLAEPGDPATGLPRVCDVIPPAIWAQYATVRSHEATENPSLESLHALRIEFKRLRYLLEFFREPLGAGAERLIELSVRAQDQLGLLNDAVVASRLIGAYLAESAASSDGSIQLAGVVAYLSDLQSEIQSRRDQFPELYRQITDKSFRRQLARVLSAV